MRYSSSLIICFAILAILFSLSACSRKNESDSGVARIDNSEEIGVTSPSNSRLDGTAAKVKTDEEVVTEFTKCMRNKGFNIPDPELNVDGTVNFEKLKESFNHDPRFDLQKKDSGKALDTCVPILANTTFTGKIDKEDPIETQDNLLEFAQCLRDQGFNVPDPDFTVDAREKMKPLVQELVGLASHSKIDAAVDLCSDFAWGGAKNPNAKKK